MRYLLIGWCSACLALSAMGAGMGSAGWHNVGASSQNIYVTGGSVPSGNYSVAAGTYWDPSYFVYYYLGGHANGQSFTAFVNGHALGGGVGVYGDTSGWTINFDGDGLYQPPGTNYCAVSTLINDTSKGIQYMLMTNGMAVAVGYLGAGKTGTWTNCASAYFTQQVYVLGPDGQYFTDPSWTEYSARPMTDTSGPPNPATPKTEDQAEGPGPVYSGGTSNVIWGTNDMRAGFSALKAALEDLAAQQHLDFLGLSNAVARGHALTNNVSVIVTNQGEANPDGSWTNVASANKTASGAQSAAESALSSRLGTVDAMISSAGAVGSGPPAGAGSVLEATIPAGSAFEFFVNFNDVRWSGLWQAMLKIWTWLLMAAYAGKVIQDVHAGVWAMFTARGVKVVPLDFAILGTGGNAAGAALAPLVVVALMVLWGVFLGVTMAGAGNLTWGAITGSLVVDPLVGVDSKALWLVCQSFPVGVATGLVGAYLTWRATMLKAILVCAGAAKFLFGA